MSYNPRLVPMGLGKDEEDFCINDAKETEDEQKKKITEDFFFNKKAFHST